MEEIYLKIKLAEEHLRNLRTALQESEKAYQIHGKSVRAPVTLIALTLPFVESVCASAKAASLAGSSRMR